MRWGPLDTGSETVLQVPMAWDRQTVGQGQRGHLDFLQRRERTPDLEVIHSSELSPPCSNSDSPELLTSVCSWHRCWFLCACSHTCAPVPLRTVIPHSIKV